HKAFSQEVDKFPAFFPLQIYNTTPGPVDVSFMRYAATAIRTWEQNSGNAPMRINGAIEARQRPRILPHVFIRTNKPAPRVSAQSEGQTFYESAVTVSWIRPGLITRDLGPDSLDTLIFKNPRAFASRDAVAVEMCQALVELYDAKVRFARSYNAQVDEQDVSTYDSDALHDLDLTAQEVTCNSLGDLLTALYVAGPSGVGSLIAHNWDSTYDYLPYMAMLARFNQIAEGVKQHPSVLEAVNARQAPTARYYDAALNHQR
ncbi:MAG TPA: hypothetical protein VIJ68_04915, partial [Candidatus Saccharimonadales bacterium]